MAWYSRGNNNDSKTSSNTDHNSNDNKTTIIIIISTRIKIVSIIVRCNKAHIRSLAKMRSTTVTQQRNGHGRGWTQVGRTESNRLDYIGTLSGKWPRVEWIR